MTTGNTRFIEAVTVAHSARCALCPGWSGELRATELEVAADASKHILWHVDREAALTIAVEYLTRHGMTVLDRDWRRDATTKGLAVIADDHGEHVAVDLRVHKNNHGGPLDRMSHNGQRAMRGLLLQWMRDHGRRSDTIRVDVIGVLGDPAARQCTLEHVRAVG